MTVQNDQKIHLVRMEVGGKEISFEIGRVARQADGAVLARCGDTVVLATTVSSKQLKKDIDFLPLTVDYQEKAYAAGKIPGGFFKREGRPSEKEILTSRLIDRSLRPLFPSNYFYEIQIIVSVLSADQGNSSDFLGIMGASAALMISDIPFNGPVAAVRVGRVGGNFVINPGYAELETSDLNVVVAGTQDAVMMVEGEAREVPEEVMLEAIELGHQEVKRVIDLQHKLRALVGREKRSVSQENLDPILVTEVKEHCLASLREAILIPNKSRRGERLQEILKEAVERLKYEEKPERTRQIHQIFHGMERDGVRRMILEKGIRADGRGPSDIRTITCEVGVMPRTHGSALFTRGETQSLAVVTLGTADDEQRIDALEGESKKTFMLHYNFPPFSVGEARPMRGPGRREIGHGALAERA